MVINLAVKDDTPMLWEIVLPSTAVFGYFIIRVIMTAAAQYGAKNKMSCGTILYSVLGFWTFKPIIDRAELHTLCDEMIMTDDDSKSTTY